MEPKVKDVSEVTFFGKPVPDWVYRAMSMPLVYVLGIIIFMTIGFLLKVFHVTIPIRI